MAITVTIRDQAGARAAAEPELAPTVTLRDFRTRVREHRS
jgi:hypothetical protein